jgi:prephenate dehydrogenase
MSVPVVDEPQPNLPAWSPSRVAVIGAGLLGGSFALAIRSRYPQATVIGVSRSQASRDAAIRRGAVHEAVEQPQQACEQADLVVLATPVDQIAALAIAAAEVCREDALITDLGSTKASIVAAVHQQPLAGSKFVGSHPIAGSEKTGADHARADLFESRCVVLTPVEATDPQRLQQAAAVWRSLGANVVVMTPEEHDRAMASISHVPHLIASTLANLLDVPLRSLAGSGWLDTTRVASGDPLMWTAICQENRTAIVAELERATAALQEFRSAITAGDDRRLMELLDSAKRCRDAVADRCAAK